MHPPTSNPTLGAVPGSRGPVRAQCDPAGSASCLVGLPRRWWFTSLALFLTAGVGSAAAVETDPAGQGRATAGGGNTLIVTTTIDEPDSDPGDGVCAASGGIGCTLRAAVQTANLSPVLNRIELPAGQFELSRAGTDDLAAVGDLDVIFNDLEIIGAGAGQTVIETLLSASEPIFQVLGGRTLVLESMSLRAVGRVIQASGPSELRNLDVTNGSLGSATVLFVLDLSDTVIEDTSINFDDIDSSILRVAGSLELRSSVVAGPFRGAPGSASGERRCLELSGGPFEIEDVTIGHCGAGFRTHNLTAGGMMVDSILHDNVVGLQNTGGQPIADGLLLARTIVIDNLRHGIRSTDFAFVRPYDLTVLDSAIVGNGGPSDGGGILHDGPQRMDIINSTLSGNRTAGSGGGLAQLDGEVHLYNVTLTDNTADSDSDEVGNGGGLMQSGGTLTARNTIIARNHDLSLPIPLTNRILDCDGAITSEGHNLIGLTFGCTLTGDLTGHLIGNPDLGALGFHGGPTPNHAPLATSQAIDAGDPAGCTDADGTVLAIDQRGLPRHEDFDLDGSTRCDLGSVERQAPFFADGFESGDTLSWSQAVP